MNPNQQLNQDALGLSFNNHKNNLCNFNSIVGEQRGSGFMNQTPCQDNFEGNLQSQVSPDQIQLHFQGRQQDPEIRGQPLSRSESAGSRIVFNNLGDNLNNYANDRDDELEDLGLGDIACGPQYLQGQQQSVLRASSMLSGDQTKMERDLE